MSGTFFGKPFAAEVTFIGAYDEGVAAAVAPDPTERLALQVAATRAFTTMTTRLNKLRTMTTMVAVAPAKNIKMTTRAA